MTTDTAQTTRPRSPVSTKSRAWRRRVDMCAPGPAGRRRSVATFGVRLRPKAGPGHVDLSSQRGGCVDLCTLAIASTDAERAARDHPDIRRSRAYERCGFLAMGGFAAPGGPTADANRWVQHFRPDQLHRRLDRSVRIAVLEAPAPSVAPIADGGRAHFGFDAPHANESCCSLRRRSSGRCSPFGPCTRTVRSAVGEERELIVDERQPRPGAVGVEGVCCGLQVGPGVAGTSDGACEQSQRSID
jgi:hypothetical protein